MWRPSGDKDWHCIIDCRVNVPFMTSHGFPLPLQCKVQAVFPPRPSVAPEIVPQACRPSTVPEFDAWSEEEEPAPPAAQGDSEALHPPAAPTPPTKLAPPAPRCVMPPRAPRPPQAPPPAHLVAAAKAAAVRAAKAKAVLPLPPPPTEPSMGVRVPFLLVPVTSVAPWSTFLTLRRGEAGKALRLQATLLQGDAVAAQAFFEAAGRMLIIRHRVPFHELGKHAPKAVLSLVPLTGDQTLRDEYDDYFTKKERMGVAACLGHALYVVPPVRAQECGIGNVMVPTKSLVGAIATAPHHSKSDGSRQAPSGTDEVRRRCRYL
eukprot:s4362_g8.t1